MISWKYDGVTSDFPCLIFDAWTGEHLTLDPAKPSITRTEEVICFTPKEIQLNLSDGIEIIDSCVPSSLRGWLGKHLRLITNNSTIVLPSTNKNISHLVTWQFFLDKKPILTGIKLKGKNNTYLGTPTLWYPPVNEKTNLKISIHNLSSRQIIQINNQELQTSYKWQAIQLNQWITQPCSYELRFYTQQQ
ncbi:hypothetical protein [Scytonema sp. NUACC26]|uniref:hypothetical protein n=1 Tax=Scytonema sp. NUACC26 TaxID=3140176 RepID=UPI0034DC5AEB